jgi:hypothetical protein
MRFKEMDKPFNKDNSLDLPNHKTNFISLNTQLNSVQALIINF